jgi:SAM-dependent methyltransferase
MGKIESIQSYYDARICSCGDDRELLGWENREAQYRRFQVLTDHFDLNGKSLLDVGCGLCGLQRYLVERGVEPDYTGTDILGEMVEMAKERNPGAKIHHTDVFSEHSRVNGVFDIVYSSGIFNLNLGNNREFLPLAVGRLLGLAKEALVFNLLNARSTDQEPQYFYYYPEEVRQLLNSVESGSSRMEIVDSYLSNDFTVICRKQE